MKSFVIGQGADCDLRITDDPYVSSRHARVWQDAEGRVWVEDMGSTNGTYVQRGSMKWRIRINSDLRPGDVLWLGGRTSIPWTRDDQLDFQ